MGECLAQLGYQDLYAIDLSLGMLEEARPKGLYKELRQMPLGEELGYGTDSFDAVISVGVFTTGHAPAHAFDELARITKPGGFIVFSLRVDLYEEGGFKEYQTGLEEAGKWKLAQLSEPYYPLPQGGVRRNTPNLGLPGHRLTVFLSEPPLTLPPTASPSARSSMIWESPGVPTTGS